MGGRKGGKKRERKLGTVALHKALRDQLTRHGRVNVKAGFRPSGTFPELKGKGKTGTVFAAVTHKNFGHDAH